MAAETVPGSGARVPSDPGARPSPARRRLRCEQGNTLVLMPAAVLILLGLGAMALDSAAIFLGQRRLVDLTAAIATDAVAAVDRERFYDPQDVEVVLDPDQVAARTAVLLAAQREDRTFAALACDPPELDGTRATVTCHATVRPVLAPFWGLADAHRLTVTETAVGVRH